MKHILSTLLTAACLLASAQQTDIVAYTNSDFPEQRLDITNMSKNSYYLIAYNDNNSKVRASVNDNYYSVTAKACCGGGMDTHFNQGDTLYIEINCQVYKRALPYGNWANGSVTVDFHLCQDCIDPVVFEDGAVEPPVAIPNCN